MVYFFPAQKYEFSPKEIYCECDYYLCNKIEAVMETTTIMNPFVVGRYLSDHYFCDREQETDFLGKQLENGY
jgi:hypothetical protein